MKVGDFEVEISSARIGGGWQSVGIMPDGKKVISAPCSSREDAEHDVKQQAEARLYPQRRYDVNRPFESVKPKSCGYCGKREPCGCRKGTRKPLPEPDDNLKQFRQDRSRSPEGAAVRKSLGMESMNLNEKKKWLKGAVNPEHKGYCTPMSKSTCTPRRKALAKRFKKGDLHQESRRHPDITEAEEAIVMHQADQLLEQIPDVYEIGPEGETVDRPECPRCGGRSHPIGDGRFLCPNCGNGFSGDISRYGAGPSPFAPPKASFYPSDGGSAGGGGGITTS